MLSEFENNLNVEIPSLDNKNKNFHMYANTSDSSKENLRSNLNFRTGNFKP